MNRWALATSASLLACGSAQAAPGYPPVTTPSLTIPGYPAVTGFDASEQIVNGLLGAAAFPSNGGLVANYPPQHAAEFLNLDDYVKVHIGRSYYDGAMTAGSNVLTTTAAHFSTADAGQPIWVVGQRADGGTVSGTITSYISPTQVGLSFTAINTSPTYGIASVQLATNGSGQYAGDTFTITGQTGQTANVVGTILDTQVSAASLVNGGSGGTASASCSMMGTTGNLRFKKNVTYVGLYVTVSAGGSITSVNSIFNPGDYTTNPNTGATAEPIVPARLFNGNLKSDACATFTGTQPTVSLTTNVVPINSALNVTSYGAFSTAQSNNSTFSVTTTHGTGLQLSPLTTRQNTGLWTEGTDNGAEVAKAITIANADQALGMRTVLWASPGACSTAGTAGVACPNVLNTGAYVIGPGTTLPTLNNGVVIKGQDKINTLFYVSPDYPGSAVFAWAGNTLISPGTTINPITMSYSAGWRGPGLSDVTIVGDVTATHEIDAVAFWDVTTYAWVHDVNIMTMPGRCFGLGTAITTGNQSKISESEFERNKCWYSGGWYGGGQIAGGGTVPAFDIMAQKTGGTASDDNRIKGTQIYSFAGICFAMHGSTGGGLGFYWIDGLRCEGGHSNGADQISIGNYVSTDGATVNNSVFNELQLIDVTLGSYAIHLQAPSGTTLANVANNNQFTNVTIAGGQPYGGGVAVDAGWNNNFQLSNESADAVDWQIGYSASGGSTLAVGNTLSTLEDTSVWNINNPTAINVPMNAYVNGGLGVSSGQYALPLSALGVSVAPLSNGLVPLANLPPPTGSTAPLQTATGTACTSGALPITAMLTQLQSGGNGYAALPTIPTGQTWQIWNNTGNTITICSINNVTGSGQAFKYDPSGTGPPAHGYGLASASHVSVSAMSVGTLETAP